MDLSGKFLGIWYFLGIGWMQSAFWLYLPSDRDALRQLVQVEEASVPRKEYAVIYILEEFSL